jgi:hypothetical protein
MSLSEELLLDNSFVLVMWHRSESKFAIATSLRKFSVAEPESQGAASFGPIMVLKMVRN